MFELCLAAPLAALAALQSASATRGSHALIAVTEPIAGRLAQADLQASGMGQQVASLCAEPRAASVARTAAAAPETSEWLERGGVPSGAGDYPTDCAQRWQSPVRCVRVQAEVVCVDWRHNTALELEQACAWAKHACDVVVGADVLVDRAHAACVAAVARTFMKAAPADGAGCGLFVHSVRGVPPEVSPAAERVQLLSDELARLGLAWRHVTVDACGCAAQCHGRGAEGCCAHAVVITLAHYPNTSSEILRELNSSLFS